MARALVDAGFVVAVAEHRGDNHKDHSHNIGALRRRPAEVPRFHSDRVQQACKPCEVIADLADGGHGALLSPLPPGLTGILGDMLNDPPGFKRSQMAKVDRKTAAFFSRHLIGAGSLRNAERDAALP